jgi:hypothetical protein
MGLIREGWGLVGWVLQERGGVWWDGSYKRGDYCSKINSTRVWFGFIMFNATFNNISVTSWRSFICIPPATKSVCPSVRPSVDKSYVVR